MPFALSLVNRFCTAVFVWARRACNRQKRRFWARAVSGKYNPAVDAYRRCVCLPARDGEGKDQKNAEMEMARLQAQGFNGTAGPSCVDEPVAHPLEMTEAEQADRLAKVPPINYCILRSY